MKVSDFGISAELSNSIGCCATFVGTSRYMSPERITHGSYSFPSDVWSLGLSLLEAATGKYPLPEAATYIEMAETIADSPELVLPTNVGLSPACLQFLGGCLRKSPEERLPADILMGSPWLVEQGVDSLEAARAVVAEYLDGRELVVTEGEGGSGRRLVGGKPGTSGRALDTAPEEEGEEEEAGGGRELI